MSGLKNEPFEGSNFVNFKDGKLVSNKETYTSIEGLITELDITDETYKGKDYRKVVLFIKDDEDNVMKLGFPLESGYGNAFVSLSNNIDFSRPVKISGGTKVLENGNSFGTMFIKQDGVNLKWYFKTDSKEVPEAEPILNKQGKQTGLDFSERNDFFHHYLLEKIRPRILNMSKGVDFAKASERLKAAGFKKKTVTGVSSNPGEWQEPKDDLPF